MTLQELLVAKGVDLNRTKLVRHNISSIDVANHLERGHLDFYQSIQLPNKFKNCDYMISFIGMQGTEGTLHGCYKINGYTPFYRTMLPENFSEEVDPLGEQCVQFDLEKTSILEELIDRLVIDWGKSTLSWYQNGTNEKEVLYILPEISPIVFTSYDKVLLSFDNLQTIVNNRKTHQEWENRLSSVAGLYLITDTKTGKHYVGSASGENGGIWGRWSDYVKTGHGNNTRLIAQHKNTLDYARNYQFSILEVFPIKRDKHEILAYEQLYKKKLCSIQFGLNDN